MPRKSFLVNVFDNIEEYLLILLFPVLVIVVFTATMIRYFTVYSLPWSEELARYTMVWMAYLGASLGVKKNAHLGVSALMDAMPEKLQPFLTFLRLGIIIVFNLLIVIFAYQIIQRQIQMDQVSPAMRIPISWAYAAIPVGSVLMTIRCLQTMNKSGK